MTTTLHEIAPDLFRISTFVPEAGIQFNQFLVRDDEPLLFETGFRFLFPEVREAVSRVVDPSTLRWVGFSHFEGDECGSLNEWLGIAPQAQAICSLTSVVTSVQDFAVRAPRALQHNEVLSTGRHRFRFRQTPHVPHCWDAGLLFEEVTRTLLASDLFYHEGDVEALTESDIVERTRQALAQFKSGPLAVPVPFTQDTEMILRGLADLSPRLIATHHGSAFMGDGARALRDLIEVIKEVGRLVPEAGGAGPTADLRGALDAIPPEATDRGLGGP
jgi:flavorubredoxin